MKIGDEVYVHGYVDEIRNDVVIIRNDGGYFGTVESEVKVAEQTEPTWEEVKEYCNKRCLDIVDSALRKKYYKQTEPQREYPTEWCEKCELWREDNCVGVAQCKRNIQILAEVYKAEQTENSSEKPNNCKYAENPSGDVWECGCFLDTYCEHQIYDRNPDGTINIVECGYEPKDEPQTENPCDGCVCDDGKHLMYCMNCKGIAWQTEPPKVETEPQTGYDKGLKLFADILFDKDKSNQFLEECKAMGIDPQTERKGE